MFGKNLLTLAAGYIAWSVVASLFSDKKWENFKKELAKAKKEWKDTKQIIFDNFLNTQGKFLETLKKEVLTKENIAYLKEKKWEVDSLIVDYKIEGIKLLEDVQSKGGEYLTTAKEKLEELYNEKKDDIDKIKWEAPEKIEEIKDVLLTIFEDFKKSLKKTIKDTKNNKK